MSEQLTQDIRETIIALHFLPQEERLKLQGVIAGMRLALGNGEQPQERQTARERVGV